MLSSSNEIQKRPAIINFRVVFTPLRLCLLKAMFYELIEGKRLLHPTHRATKKFISEREKFFFRLRTINLGISIPRGVVDERRINKRWDFFFQSSLKRIRFLLRRSRVLERFSKTEKTQLTWMINVTRKENNQNHFFIIFVQPLHPSGGSTFNRTFFSFPRVDAIMEKGFRDYSGWSLAVIPFGPEHCLTLTYGTRYEHISAVVGHEWDGRIMRPWLIFMAFHVAPAIIPARGS